jgi:hypothetical protein
VRGARAEPKRRRFVAERECVCERERERESEFEKRRRFVAETKRGRFVSLAVKQCE